MLPKAEPWRAARNDERRDTPLASFAIGDGGDDNVASQGRIGDPHLLAIDDPFVTVERCTGTCGTRI